MAEPRNRYSTVSLLFHWGIALAVLAQVLLIAASDASDGQPAAREFVGAHKALGLTILVATLARIGWRLANPAIPLPPGTPGWQKIAARANHVAFYVVLIGLPLGGWAASSAGGRDIDYFGLFNWPLLPLPLDRDLAGQFMDAHRAGVKLLYVLLALHVLAALKHQFLDRDNVLHRMIPLIPRRP
ncbi:cytochrome b [Brevundimonas aurifodinae]|uniref:Cytochrome b n=2 Tax=Brevundimonas TaxID=41275 RepID=A0ABV1NL97_9CAUL|nr:MAG: cytochrome b [Brevundimonas sp. 12-68-7]OYX32796.1 MAG: cytochrome b [Brevundimonas subvibrioides]